MSYPSSRSIVSGGSGGISRKGEREFFALGNFYLESLNPERANRKKKVGSVVKRGGWSWGVGGVGERPTWESKRREEKSRALGVRKERGTTHISGCCR